MRNGEDGLLHVSQILHKTGLLAVFRRVFLVVVVFETLLLDRFFTLLEQLGYLLEDQFHVLHVFVGVNN